MGDEKDLSMVEKYFTEFNQYSMFLKHSKFYLGDLENNKYENLHCKDIEFSIDNHIHNNRCYLLSEITNNYLYLLGSRCSKMFDFANNILREDHILDIIELLKDGNPNIKLNQCLLVGNGNFVNQFTNYQRYDFNCLRDYNIDNYSLNNLDNNLVSNGILFKYTTKFDKLEMDNTYKLYLGDKMEKIEEGDITKFKFRIGIEILNPEDIIYLCNLNISV